MAQKSTLMIVLSSFLLPTCFLNFFGLPSVATNDGTPVGPFFFFPMRVSKAFALISFPVLRSN